MGRNSTTGVVAVSAMDLGYHHGSRFIPGVGLLLHGVVR